MRNRTYLEDLIHAREELLARDLDDPIEGTTVTIWPEISTWIGETFQTSGTFISPAMAERIWVCERCIQLNAQQIASMPVEFHSTAPGGGYRPAWLDNPDPVWFPNGIGDAIFEIVRSIYGRGYAILLITARYASGFPSAWTVLDPATVKIGLDERRRRAYEVNDRPVPASEIVQIDRNPGRALHGTSALAAYASIAWGVVSSAELSRTFLSGGVPQTVLESERRLNKAQAEALQTQWVEATSRRGAAPPVLSGGVKFSALSISPEDLSLLASQEFGARALASAYGVPAHMLNMAVSGGLTYQNPAMLGEQWWRFELRPRAKTIVDALSAQMLPAGSWVTVDASDTFAPIFQEEDDPQLAGGAAADPPDAPPVAGASPSDQNGTRVVPIRGAGG